MRSIHNNNNRADNAEEASNFPDHAETLFEEDGREDSCDNNGQCAERSDENCIGEGICDKVEDFANDHECHSRPPVEVFEVSISFSGNLVVFLVGAQ